jgi:hypothetical protein
MHSLQGSKQGLKQSRRGTLRLDGSAFRNRIQFGQCSKLCVVFM